MEEQSHWVQCLQQGLDQEFAAAFQGRCSTCSDPCLLLGEHRD